MLLRRFVRSSVQYKKGTREQYESIFSRLFKKAAKNDIQKVNPMTGETNKKNPILALLEDPEPDEKMKDLTQYDPRNRITMSVKEDKEIFLEENKDISDLERQRMTNIDKVLGTSTHFHETKVFEERLDSEHVMERKIVKLEQNRKKLNAFDRLLSTDPQKKRATPKIRNFTEFSQRMVDIRSLPKHEKESTILKTQYETLVDSYAYLKLKTVESAEITVQDLDDKHNAQSIFENEMIQKRIDSFVSKENMYTDMSLIKVSQLEDQLLTEMRKKLDIHDNIPLYTDRFIYFNRDPRVTKECALTLYRTPIDKFRFKAFDVMEVEKDEVVVTKQELLNFLEEYVELDKRIEHLADEMELGNVVFADVIMNPKHDLIAFFFDLYNDSKEFILVVKDMSKGTFVPRVFSGVDSSAAFDNFGGLYFVQKNDLERFSLLVKVNVRDQDVGKNVPTIIMEEKDPNYQFKLRQINNKDIILVDSCSLSGNTQNQLYFKEAYIENSVFRLILARSLEKHTELKMGETAFFFTQSEKDQRPTKLMRAGYSRGSRDIAEIDKTTERRPAAVNMDVVYQAAKKMVASNTLSVGTEREKLLARIERENQQPIEVGEVEEVLLEAAEGEYIRHFEVFEHYVAVLLSQMPQQKDSIKIYNAKTKQFHTLAFQQDLYDILPENNQFYTSNSYHFTLQTPSQPSNFMSYNMAMRDLQSYHVRLFVNFQSNNYQMERLEAPSRDGVQIPFTLVYNKTQVNANSPCILYLNQEETKRGPYDLSPNMVTVLDRGIIIAYPHMRGTYDLSSEWLQSGCCEKRLTNFCDLIDIAKFIRNQEISTKICGYSNTPLSGLTLFSAMLNEPNLIRTSVIHNGLLDVVGYLQQNQNKETINIFGDIKNDRDMYEFIKDYSPYQMDLSEIDFENIMFTCRSDHPLSHQTRKFMAKLRENRENSEVYFREYSLMPQESMEIQQLSFLMSTAFFKLDAPEAPRKQQKHPNDSDDE